LEVVLREKQQSSGGRMDFLLQDSDDDSMYEVEMMLGETDPSHIIRTIEYWDIERQRWPKRSHTAVLVAEHLNRRFFNVIHLLSQTIPIIAIQANLVEADGKRFLHFTTILDAYAEPESKEPMPTGPINENYWQEKSPSMLDHAKKLQKIFSSNLGEIELRFNKSGIRFYHDECHFCSVYSLAGGNSRFMTWMSKEEMADAKKALENVGISFKEKTSDSGWPNIRFGISQETIQANVTLFQELAKLMKKSWQDCGELK